MNLLSHLQQPIQWPPCTQKYIINEQMDGGHTHNIRTTFAIQMSRVCSKC